MPPLMEFESVQVAAIDLIAGGSHAIVGTSIRVDIVTLSATAATVRITT